MPCWLLYRIAIREPTLVFNPFPTLTSFPLFYLLYSPPPLPPTFDYPAVLRLPTPAVIVHFFWNESPSLRLPSHRTVSRDLPSYQILPPGSPPLDRHTVSKRFVRLWESWTRRIVTAFCNPLVAAKGIRLNGPSIPESFTPSRLRRNALDQSLHTHRHVRDCAVSVPSLFGARLVSTHTKLPAGTMSANGAPGDDWHPHVFRMPDWVEPVVCSWSCQAPSLVSITRPQLLGKRSQKGSGKKKKEEETGLVDC